MKNQISYIYRYYYTFSINISSGGDSSIYENILLKFVYIYLNNTTIPSTILIISVAMFCFKP